MSDQAKIANLITEVKRLDRLIKSINLSTRTPITNDSNVANEVIAARGPYASLSSNISAIWTEVRSSSSSSVQLTPHSILAHPDSYTYINQPVTSTSNPEFTNPLFTSGYRSTGLNKTNGVLADYTKGSLIWSYITDPQPAGYGLSLMPNGIDIVDVDENGDPTGWGDSLYIAENGATVNVGGDIVITGSVTSSNISTGSSVSGSNTGDSSGHSGLFSLDQTVPQTLINLPVSQTGLLKVTSGTIGVDTSTYLTSLTGSFLLDQTTPQTIINGSPIFNVGLTSPGQVYIGTSTVNSSYRVHISNNFTGEYARPFLIEGRSSSTGSQVSPLTIGLTTSADMIDNFGCSLLYAITDNANVENFIGRINCFRAGADNTGAMSFSLYKTGTLLERMRVHNSGNVSIGQTTDASYKLDVKSIAGNVSIPVFTGSGLNDVVTTSTTYTGTDITTQAYYVTCDGNGTPDTFKWKKGVAGTETTGVPFSASFVTLTDGIRIAWSSTNGHTIGDQWRIEVTVSQPMQLLNAASTKVLTTDNAGNTIVGVPTGSATQILEVIKTSSGALGAVNFIRNLSSTASSAVSLRLSPSTLSARYSEIQAVNDGSNNIDMRFLTGTGATISEKMRITNTGNVGIGTTSIGARLHALSTTEQLRLGYDANNYMSATVASNNAVTITNAIAADININCGTDKTLVLTETVYDDLVCPLFSAKTGTSNVPTWQALVGNINAYRFATDDYLESCTELLHSYKEGTAIEVHIHWATNGVDADDRAVAWEVEYTIANMGTGTFSASTVISGQTTIAASTADRTHKYTSMSTTIPGTGRKIGDVIMLRIKRIAATGGLSAPSANPFGLNLGLHYEKDTLGSRQIGIK